MQPPTRKDLNDVDAILSGGKNIRIANTVPVADYEALLRVAHYWKEQAERPEQAISDEELNRLHDAAKIIEYDGAQAYRTCCQRFGKDITNALLVAYFRRNEMSGPLNVYPEPEGLRDKVNQMLIEQGVL